MSLEGGREREARLFLPLTSACSVCAFSMVHGGPTWPAVQVLLSSLSLPGASAIVQLLPGSPPGNTTSFFCSSGFRDGLAFYIADL